MTTVTILPAGSMGRGFIPAEHLPKGEDEYYLRNRQVGRPLDHWRHLRSDELETLVKNGNTCDNWDDVRVTEEFDPARVKSCELSGLVRIGRISDSLLEHHDMRMPVGISNSRIISCDIGDDCAIHDVRYLAHYIVGDRNMLVNVDEMHTTNHAKFGNGVVKEGEDEGVRVWMDLMNEIGTRAVMPFDGMLPADAYIWARYREDAALQKRLAEITQATVDSRRGYYGTTGEQCVIKSSRIIKDVKFGPHCYVKGANKIKNVTINSSMEEPTQIGEGVELVNGIIGYGCHIFYGCKAVRFVMGNNTNLKYGARLLHSVLGANSTVSCCEILFNLIFPAHEQHHNNSFLTASLVMGQSNLAAGATVGSNHNSRANDGEIVAGRGFWPGLCTTLKHSCRFASFTLLAKADYPYEIVLPLPFSLVSDDPSGGRLRVMPAYWWLHNMYALARNTWKFQTRDKRRRKYQNIEFDSLAPDTAEEIFTARELLEIWTAKARLRADGRPDGEAGREELAALGRELLNGPEERTKGLAVHGENIERSRRPVSILKTREAYHAYGEMLLYYAVTNLLAHQENREGCTLAEMARELGGQPRTRWENIGGQLVSQEDMTKLLEAIKGGELADWESIHRAYDLLWEQYPAAKTRHAFAALCRLHSTDTLSVEQWMTALDEARRIQEHINAQVRASRQKDFDNPFRQATFRSRAEMEAVVGTIDGNGFVRTMNEETEAFGKRVAEVKAREK